MNKKKKIYWLHAHFLFAMGGAKFDFKVASILNNDPNIEIIFVANKVNKEVVKKLNEENIKVITFSNLCTNNLLYWLFFPINFLYDYFHVKKIVKDANLIITNFFPPNLLGLICGRKLKIPVFNYCFEPFFFFHDNHFIERQPIFQKLAIKLIGFLYKNLDIYAIKNSDKVFTLNPTTNKAIKKVYGRKDAILTRVGIDLEFFHHEIKSSIKKAYKNNIVISHFTDYTEMKRTDLAITAISHLVKKYPEIKLIITSTQPNHPNKKKLIKLVKKLNCEKNVDFLGLVPYEDLPSYYSIAKVYITSAYDKMLGAASSNMTNKEALACETPVIRCPIINEDVEDGVSGFLIDPRKTKQVAERIEYLIKNPEIAKKMGKLGRKKIKMLYDWNNVADIINKELINSLNN